MTEKKNGNLVSIKGAKKKYAEEKKKTDRMDSEILAYSILMRNSEICPLDQIPFVFNYNLYFDGRGGVVIRDLGGFQRVQRGKECD